MTKSGIDRSRHRRILRAVLKDVVRVLSDRVVFKGGTAAMLFYHLPRLSLDLDFDLLEPIDRETRDRLEIALRRHGNVREARDKRFTLFFLLDYEPAFPNIKIEFNKRIWRMNRYRTVRNQDVIVRIPDKATMFSNKLVAVTERRTVAARDLYDIYFFLKERFPVNGALIEERTGRTVAEHLRFLVRFIPREFTEKNLLQGLGEVMDEKQKDWVRRNLIVEIMTRLKRLADSGEKGERGKKTTAAGTSIL